MRMRNIHITQDVRRSRFQEDLNSTTALSAEVGARTSGGSAAAAKAPASNCGQKMYARHRFGDAGPQESHDPTNARPTQEEVEKQDSSGVAFVSTDDRRKEIEQEQQNQAKHRAPHNGRIAGIARHT
jgi:hypothetical protein